MKITIYTLFPAWFDGPLGDSIVQRAQESGRLQIDRINFRDYAQDRHKTVDETPYGGGGGMVLRPDVLAHAMDNTIGPPGQPGRPYTVYLSPRGRRFDQDMARQFALLPGLALLCGHYEAVDQRLLDSRVDEEVSLGDFVLTGGEIPAMAVVDAVARLLPGVLGNESSAQNDSFMDGLLEGPHYTRPEEFEGHGVPDVLLSGDHAAIEQWREEQALKTTRQRRPDLHEEQILYPAQVRRLARRRRPFAVWREGREGASTLLFANRSVLQLQNWRELPEARHASRGVHDLIRFAEFRDARTENTEADRDLVSREIDEAAHAFLEGRALPDFVRPAARRLVLNLWHEIRKIQEAPDNRH